MALEPVLAMRVVPTTAHPTWELAIMAQTMLPVATVPVTTALA
jgi:hypothetical protein